MIESDACPSENLALSGCSGCHPKRNTAGRGRYDLDSGCFSWPFDGVAVVVSHAYPVKSFSKAILTTNIFRLSVINSLGCGHQKYYT
ncbi:MAG: hypothetical protein JXB23_18610 [Candidatus Aminicenantes bacterium]|nr:hypothetical protein [Candidatus Aminicenantes bacterium]